MNKKYFLLFGIIFLLNVLETYAWWSIEMPANSNHRKLTAKAIDQIKNIQNDTAKCPDIERFGNQIIEWTTYPGNDENAHGKKVGTEEHPDAGKYNGGPYGIWWYDTLFPNVGVLTKYNQRNFSNGEYSAYYYLAMMAHLIADQAVPAHAANIAHAFPKMDGLEALAYEQLSINWGGTLTSTDYKRYYYFKNDLTGEIDGSIPLTQSKLPDWKLGGLRYWFENDSTKFRGDAFDSAWGSYGVIYTPVDTQNIIQLQFQQSVIYMDGFLRLVSKSLPPVVSELALTDNTILQNSSTAVKFRVDENRQPNVRISLSVDNRPIKATNIVWDSAEKMLQPNDEDDELPYRGQFSIDWDGKLADETYPTDGQHDLVVQVQDADGNWSDSSAVSFTIDRFTIDTTPPEVVNAFPDGSILNKKNTSISATLGDTGSGIDTTSVKIELDGVLKDVGIQVFEGGAIGIYYSAENLAEGTRRWKVIGRDLVGNQIIDTEHTFKVDTIKPKVKSFSIGGKAFKIK